jgi:hypothetical protein
LTSVCPTETSILDDIEKIEPKFKIEYQKEIWDGTEKHIQTSENDSYYQLFNAEWFHASNFFEKAREERQNARKVLIQ